MKIFVIGNINAGKTFYINKLKNIFSNYEVIAIDDFRKKYGDGTIKNEKLARKKFVQKINNTNDCLVEFSGLGEFVDKINKKNYLVIHVNTNKDVCIQRINDDKFAAIPYPKEWNQPINKTIEDLDYQITSGIYQNLWFENALKTFTINDFSDFNAIHFNYFIALSKVINSLAKFSVKCVSFGGLAKKILNDHSDIDLFLISKKSVEEIKQLLKTNLSIENINRYQNKIYFLMDNISIEIICCKKLKEISSFFGCLIL